MKSSKSPGKTLELSIVSTFPYMPKDERRENLPEQISIFFKALNTTRNNIQSVNMMRNANTKHEPDFSSKRTIKENMSHSFMNPADRANINISLLISYGKSVQQELPLKTLNFRLNRSFP